MKKIIVLFVMLISSVVTAFAANPESIATRVDTTVIDGVTTYVAYVPKNKFNERRSEVKKLDTKTFRENKEWSHLLKKVDNISLDKVLLYEVSSIVKGRYPMIPLGIDYTKEGDTYVIKIYKRLLENREYLEDVSIKVKLI